jgi:hypothetical protein
MNKQLLEAKLCEALDMIDQLQDRVKALEERISDLEVKEYDGIDREDGLETAVGDGT